MTPGTHLRARARSALGDGPLRSELALPDRQRRNVAARKKAEERCDRCKRRAGSKRVGLGPHDAEDELERRVVELVQFVERHFEIARRAGARQLELFEGE